MIYLQGRFKSGQADSRVGATLLELAMEQGIDWGFSCTRGTCARCRCLVESGAELLGEVTEAEWQRLSDEELEEGYRLGCQAEIRAAGDIRAINKPYF